MKVNKIVNTAHAFPRCLKDIPSSPKALYYLGNRELLDQKPALAVVGSRRVTPYGKGTTTHLVRTVAEKGVCIVSGLALGVDALAHQAALDAGGKTIAVLPCGLDNPYPATNRQLARRILEQDGLLISEYPDGTPPLRQHFIARNRLVSGLGDGVLITEAAEKSGTLHTANFALEQGKAVMAVPGNITSANSAGTNNLIKTGAAPITSASDILHALGLEDTTEHRDIQPANAEEAILLDLLKQGISDGAELQMRSQLSAVQFNQTLTMMEISGKIRPTGAGHWTTS